MNREFPIRTAVRFLWRDPDGALRMGVGVTQHISRSSVCIRTQDFPSLGAKVQVIVDMPPARVNTRPGRLVGEGFAVRLERAFGQPTAFAANIRFRSKWGCPSSPMENSAQWRKEAINSTIPHERVVGPVAQECWEDIFYDANVDNEDGHTRLSA